MGEKIMKMNKFAIKGIPTIVFGEPSNKVYIYVHGKMGEKEEALSFAKIATVNGFQVISFDLPEHGERTEENYRNNIWNAISDLKEIFDYTKAYWENINLYAVSLGAYYSLMAYNSVCINNCMFVSPIIDMKAVIENMLIWSGNTIEHLVKKRNIDTSFGETLNIDYYNFVLENPVRNWSHKTSILYGMKDNMTDFGTVMGFSKKFGCKLTTFSDMEHYLHSDKDLKRLKDWQEKSIC